MRGEARQDNLDNALWGIRLAGVVYRLERGFSWVARQGPKQVALLGAKQGEDLEGA